MPENPQILRLAAFTDTPDGGNPAGVVLDARGLTDADMQRIAADVGYSETAFLTDPDALTVRYFSPLAEVPFCGHATIATAVALAERDGPGTRTLQTRAGAVPVVTARDAHGALTATLTSVAPRVDDAPPPDLQIALTALRLDADADLDPSLPPRIAYAGARHLIVGLLERDRLAALDYDFDALKTYMSIHDLITVAVVQREDATTFHVRNPFPPGGVVEDPATGAAAAALGAYLRARRLLAPPVQLTLHQGADLGRPSLLLVDVDRDPASGVRVTGRAVKIPA